MIAAQKSAVINHLSQEYEFYHFTHERYKPTGLVDAIASRPVNGGYELRSRIEISIANPENCKSLYLSHIVLEKNTFDSRIQPVIEADDTVCSGQVCKQMITISLKTLRLEASNARQLEEVREGVLEFQFHINGMCGRSVNTHERQLTTGSARIIYHYNLKGIQESAMISQQVRAQKRELKESHHSHSHHRRSLPECTSNADCLFVYNCVAGATCNTATNQCEDVTFNTVCSDKNTTCSGFTCSPFLPADQLDSDGCSVHFSPLGTPCDLPPEIADGPFVNPGETGQCDTVGGCVWQFAQTDSALDGTVTSTDSTSSTDDDGDDDDDVSHDDLKVRFGNVLGFNNVRAIHEDDSDAIENEAVLTSWHKFDPSYVQMPWLYSDEDTLPAVRPTQRIRHDGLNDDEEDDDDLHFLQIGLELCSVPRLKYSDGVETPYCGVDADDEETPNLNGVFLSPDDDDDTGSSINPNPRACSIVCYGERIEYEGNAYCHPKICTRKYFPRGVEPQSKTSLVVSATLLTIVVTILLFYAAGLSLTTFFMYYVKMFEIPNFSFSFLTKFFRLEGDVGKQTSNTMNSQYLY